MDKLDIGKLELITVETEKLRSTIFGVSVTTESRKRILSGGQSGVTVMGLDTVVVKRRPNKVVGYRPKRRKGEGIVVVSVKVTSFV